MASSDFPQSAARLERPLTLLFALLAGALAGMALLANAFVALGMDQAWLTYASDRMLSGAPIYGAEVMESNPPFILWLYSLPDWLARLLHRPDAFGFRIFVVVVTLLALAWCVVLLRHLVTAKRALLAWAFTSGIAGITFYLANKGDAGQREHMMTLFILPYLFAAALRLRGVRIPPAEAFLLGLSAAVAVCCKVHHVLVVFGIELLLMANRRSLRSLLRPEFYGVVAGGVAYLAAVDLFAPRYLHGVVPLLTQTYWAFGGIPLSTMVLQKRSLLMLLVIAGCAAVARTMQRKLQTATLQATLLTAAFFSLAAYWVQGTGFNYQLIPVGSLLALAVLVLAADGLTSPWRAVNHETTAPLPGSRASWPPTPIAPLAAWLAPVVFAVVCGLVMVGMRGHVRARAEAKELATVDAASRALFDSYPAGTPVYWMALDPGFFPAAVEHHFVWGSRFPHLWMLPAIVRTEQHQPNLKKQLTPAQVDALTATQDRFMVEDLEHWKPKLVGVQHCSDPVVDACEGMRGSGVDLLRWFEGNAEFRQEWAHYKFKETAGRYDFFVRED
jgi:hypothetical protein